MATIGTDSTPGLSLYAQFRQDPNVWNGAALVALESAVWADTDTAFVETGSTGSYLATVPPTLPVGRYRVYVYLRISSAPAVTDTLLGTGDGTWDGVTFTSLSATYGDTGSVEWEYTVFQSNGTTPIPDAAVYVSSDAAGLNRSNTRIADDTGKVTFWLDPGTVYVWRRHPLFAFSDPDTEVVA